MAWSPTGTSISDDPKLAPLLWQNIGDPISGAKTPQEALDSPCAEQGKVRIRLEKAGVQGDIGPKMNDAQDPQVRLDAPGGRPRANFFKEIWPDFPKNPGSGGPVPQ